MTTTDCTPRIYIHTHTSRAQDRVLRPHFYTYSTAHELIHTVQRYTDLLLCHVINSSCILYCMYILTPYFRTHQVVPNYQRWALALISRFCAFALASAKPKKERESAKKKESEKSESAERERKKARIRAFSCHPQWKSSFRAQSSSAGGKARVLSEIYSSVC